MTPALFRRAARVPRDVPLGRHGPWTITRRRTPEDAWGRGHVGFPDYTILARHTLATLNDPVAEAVGGEVVMEDTARELDRHMPIWQAARGHVLVTGLGLGCVVRGLLAKPAVDHVTVIEHDLWIRAALGPAFRAHPRCTLIAADALTYLPPPGARWDYAWHDIWSDVPAGAPHLQMLHARLFARFDPFVAHQGAWQFPRLVKHMLRRRGVAVVGGYRPKLTPMPARGAATIRGAA